MKKDEQDFFEELQRRSLYCKTGNLPYVRELAIRLEIPEKRAAYICQKWSNKGWYEYGVSILAGWLTERGKTKKLDTHVKKKRIKNDS